MKRFDYFDSDDDSENFGHGHGAISKHDKSRRGRNGSRHRDGRRVKVKQHRKTTRYDDYYEYE